MTGIFSTRFATISLSCRPAGLPAQGQLLGLSRVETRPNGKRTGAGAETETVFASGTGLDSPWAKGADDQAKFRVDKFHGIKNTQGPDKDLEMELIIPPPGQLANRVVDLINVELELGGKS